MAILEKIRSKMGVIVLIVVGLSLLSFILTDFLSSGKSAFNKDQTKVAEIAGKTINIQDYQALIDKTVEIYKLNTNKENIDEQTMDQLREQTWQQLLEENILGEEYHELGLAVSAKEVFDMVQGVNPHPIIVQLFTNPETKEFNRGNLMNFLKNLDKDQTGKSKKFWLYLESEIMRERIKNKYFNLLKKGLYATTEQVKQDQVQASKQASISYISMPFATVSDSAIKVSESELKDYLKKHEVEFKQEASRDLVYIEFPIVPSQEDYTQGEKWINKIKGEFVDAKDAKQFVNLNSDIPADERYYKQNELPDTLKKMFNAKAGETFGPYFENGTYKIARFVESKNSPDSVKARHILIRPAAQTKEAEAQAKALADSLFKVVKKGGNFAELAKQYSVDGSKDKGGDLGWFKEGAMVKPFNDACFNAKKGEAMQVTTQFGFHIIEVTEKGKESKKVQIAVLQRRIEPSTATYQAIYQKASTFAGKNNTAGLFNSAIQKENMQAKPANYVPENVKQIPGLEGSREMVRWAYKSEKNTVSPIFEFGGKFVVALLTQVREKGTPTIDQVKDQLEYLVKKDKKADQLAQKLNADLSGVNTINDLAAKTNTQVQAAENVTFASYAIPGLGFEPKVVAAATTLAPSKLSKPVKGNNGVYVIYVNNVNETPVDANSSAMRLNGSYQNRVTYEVFNILKDIANVSDQRSKFF